MSYISKKTKFIFGCTDLAQLLYANLLDLGESGVEAFVSHRQYCTSNELMGLPIIAFEDISNYFTPTDAACYICIGYSEMNKHRALIAELLEKLGYEILDFKHPKSFIKACSIGTGNIFFANSFIDFFTEIGSYNIFYPNSMLSHHSCLGSFNFFAVAACVAGHCKVGNGNFIGANSTVANNVEIANHCLIGAGAYLPHNLEDLQVFAPSRGLVLKNKTSTDFL